MDHPAVSLDLSGMVTGLFRDRTRAERAYRAASERGYENSDINVLMSEDTRKRWFPENARTHTELGDKAVEATEKSPKGAELGGPVGGMMGTIAPVIAAVGTLLLIPGIIVAGPLAVALAAAGAVGVAGGLVGALTDWGIPKERIRQYEQGIREGGILIGVKPRSPEDAAYLEGQWKASGGELVHS